MKKINEDDINISTAISLLAENDSKLLQLHSFSDIEKKNPVFVAFFILGNEGEPAEAIKEIDKLKLKWNNINTIEILGDIKSSYIIQQLDLEGPYNITKECGSLEELCSTAKQCGIRNLALNQRIIKRIDIPLGLTVESGDFNENNS